MSSMSPSEEPLLLPPDELLLPELPPSTSCRRPGAPTPPGQSAERDGERHEGRDPARAGEEPAPRGRRFVHAVPTSSGSSFTSSSCRGIDVARAGPSVSSAETKSPT